MLSTKQLVTREEIIWLYKCLLQREPENEGAISAQLGHDFNSVRSAILASQEFLETNIADREGYYFPPKQRSHTVALACIVKNEARRICRMVLSCLPIINFVSVVDTGSTDDTIEITQSLLQDKLPRAFSLKEVAFDSFSASRNRAIDLVPASIDWILMLDADEELVEEDFGRLQSLLYHNVDAWHLPRLNFLDEAKLLPARPYPDHQCRLFRNNPHIRFVGNVHERLSGTTSEFFAPCSNALSRIVGGPHIHHLGQVGLTNEAWQTKHDFYTKLANSA